MQTIADSFSLSNLKKAIANPEAAIEHLEILQHILSNKIWIWGWNEPNLPKDLAQYSTRIHKKYKNIRMK